MYGLDMGMKILENRKYKNEIAAILLLTDGQDSSSAQAVQQQKNTTFSAFIKKTNSSIHTFGFGADHDASVMSTIAECCGGTFTYVENNSIIGPAFATVLGGLMSIVAQKIVINLSALENSTISKIRTDYQNKLSVDRKVGNIVLPDLYSEESKDIVFHLNIPSSSPTDEQKVITANVEFYLVGETSPRNIVATGILKRSEKITSKLEVNLQLDLQRNRILSNEAMEKALDFAQSGKFKEAKQVLNETMDLIKKSSSGNTEEAKSLIEDLTLSLQKMSSQNEYSNGGYAQVKSAQMQNKQQRANYQPQKQSAPQPMNSMQMQQNVAWNNFQQQQPIFQQQPQFQSQYQMPSFHNPSVGIPQQNLNQQLQPPQPQPQQQQQQQQQQYKQN